MRVGDLHVEEAPWLRFPMLLGLPLSRPLWVDTGSGPGAAAVQKVRALVTRLLAAYPAGGLEVLVIDLVGGLAPSLAALDQPGSRVMTTLAATSVAAAGEVLDALVRRVDLVQMARSAGAMDALGGDDADRLLVLHDFPTALDDAAVGRLRYLVDEGPSAGVQVLLTGEHSSVLDGSPLVTTAVPRVDAAPPRTGRPPRRRLDRHAVAVHPRPRSGRRGRARRRPAAGGRSAPELTGVRRLTCTGS